MRTRKTAQHNWKIQNIKKTGQCSKVILQGMQSLPKHILTGIICSRIGFLSHHFVYSKVSPLCILSLRNNRRLQNYHCRLHRCLAFLDPRNTFPPCEPFLCYRPFCRNSNPIKWKKSLLALCRQWLFTVLRIQCVPCICTPRECQCRQERQEHTSDCDLASQGRNPL